jgi:hypothetical protein
LHFGIFKVGWEKGGFGAKSFMLSAALFAGIAIEMPVRLWGTGKAQLGEQQSSIKIGAKTKSFLIC